MALQLPSDAPVRLHFTVDTPFDGLVISSQHPYLHILSVSGPTSYVATTAEFLAHWTDVNTALPAAAPLVLEGGTTREVFETTRTNLLALRDAVVDAALGRSLARAELEIRKEWLLVRFNMFNDKVRAEMSASPYARVLSLAPTISEAQAGFSRPMTATAKLWAKVNSAPPAGYAGPLVLLDGTTQAAFAAAVVALAGGYDALVEAEQDVSLALARRNDEQDVIYEMMKRYRRTVPTRVPAGDALLDTLPDLTPEANARKPAAVALAGAWNAAGAEAELTVAAPSTDPDLRAHELRACSGPDYEEELEVVVARVPAGAPAPLDFRTTRFLETPGAKACFRVYVLIRGGTETGSEPVVVSRPV